MGSSSQFSHQVIQATCLLKSTKGLLQGLKNLGALKSYPNPSLPRLYRCGSSDSIFSIFSHLLSRAVLLNLILPIDSFPFYFVLWTLS